MKVANNPLLISCILCCAACMAGNAYSDEEESLSAGLHSVRDNEEVRNAVSKGVETAYGTMPQDNPIRNEDRQAGDAGEKGDSARPLESPREVDAVLPRKDGLAELRAFVDKSTITIGEKVTYTLEIDADNDLEVEFPAYVSGLGGFVVKDFGKDDKRIGRRRLRKTRWYLLDTYTTGSYVIPPQSVKVKLPGGRTETLKSPRIFVEVKSVMDGKEGEAGLRDIKGPLTVISGVPAAWIIGGVLIILTAGGIIFGKIYRGKIRVKKPGRLLTPGETAFMELEKIEGLGLIEASRIKEYYYSVSLVLRSYLENRFSLKAPEQTTEEFLECVVRSDKIERKHINILKEYLNHCDLVKYAKFEPGRAQARSLIETTRRFIEETAELREENGEKATN